MNTFGSIRSEGTKEKIQKALMYLLKRKNFNEIYVKDICKIACINRSSFYSHYEDINDLMLKTEQKLSKHIESLFSSIPYYDRNSFIKMFNFIRENADFYSAFLKNHGGSFMAETDFNNFRKKIQNNSIVKLQYSDSEIIYHLAFFSAGLTAICKVWLNDSMKESPEELADIIQKEYESKIKFFANKN